jgi:hypothetical protein
MGGPKPPSFQQWQCNAIHPLGGEWLFGGSDCLAKCPWHYTATTILHRLAMHLRCHCTSYALHFTMAFTAKKRGASYSQRFWSWEGQPNTIQVPYEFNAQYFWGLLFFFKIMNLFLLSLSPDRNWWMAYLGRPCSPNKGINKKNGVEDDSLVMCLKMPIQYLIDVFTLCFFEKK